MQSDEGKSKAMVWMTGMPRAIDYLEEILDKSITNNRNRDKKFSQK